MLIATLNYAPHVGKSVLARHLILPRIPGAELLLIDPYRPLNGKHTFDTVCNILMGDNLVVDIPYWQTCWLFNAFRDYEGLHKEWDYFVIPTTAESDLTARLTIATLSKLSEIGVPANKIRLVFNAVDRRTDLSQAFSALYRYWNKETNFELNDAAVIHYSPVFPRIFRTDLAFEQMVENPARDLQRAAPTAVFEDNYAQKKLVAANRKLPGVQAELDAVFRMLVG